MAQFNRRTFLKHTALSGGTWLAASAKSYGLMARQKSVGRPLGANERIRIAIAGLRGKGTDHIVQFAKLKDQNVEIACLVDPDSRLFESRLKLCEDHGVARPQVLLQDIRYALDDRNLDGISIVTPNHWHSLMTIWACQAGKDVLVEKPLSHNIHEGRIAVEVARKYQRIVQHGTQRRGEPLFAKMIAIIHSGQLGKLLISRGLCYKTSRSGLSTRGDIGYAPHVSPPRELDFDIWLGPASRQPYHDNLVHYRWHWFWDFGGGDITNQGVHEMDIARWAIRNATLPDSVISFGGRLGRPDQGETARTQVAIMNFGATKLIFEVRGRESKPMLDVQVGNIFHLEAGTVAMGNRDKEIRFYPTGSNEPAPLPEVEYALGPGRDKHENWIMAMRSRRVSDLNADILEGHYSAALCHLANISYRLGGKVPFQPIPEELATDPDAVEVFERTKKHLADHGIDIEKGGLTLGRTLCIDKMAERILDDPQANDLCSRHYRKPYVVPDGV